MNLAAKIHKKQQKTQLLSKFFLKSVNYVKGMATVHTDKDKKRVPQHSQPKHSILLLKYLESNL